MKAVIVDLCGSYAAALNENGVVVRVRNKHYALGQEIELRSTHRPGLLKRVGAIAAAAVLSLSVCSAAAYATPYGTVTLNGEQELEYTINWFDYVLSVKALNQKGETVLEELDLSSVRHRPIRQAVASTVAHLEQSGRAEQQAVVEIMTGTRSAGHTQRLQAELEEELKEHTPEPPSNPTPEGTGNAPEKTEKVRQPGERTKSAPSDVRSDAHAEPSQDAHPEATPEEEHPQGRQKSHRDSSEPAPATEAREEAPPERQEEAKQREPEEKPEPKEKASGEKVPAPHGPEQPKEQSNQASHREEKHDSHGDSERESDPSEPEKSREPPNQAPHREEERDPHSDREKISSPDPRF